MDEPEEKPFDKTVNFRCFIKEHNDWKKARLAYCRENGLKMNKYFLSDWIRDVLNAAAEAQLNEGQKTKPKS
ncbi:hypothetical protein KOR42_06230 [Thalassoglobus neptunius]|uniref:Uncharacterized protein n=1 Tax=Thalassoglobus neptunius TaxID=1938619 RepID=A0A5C5X4Y4_9PLAN|nr:hypothetical protein [Thalassoglobus neptunius]TWT57265.1 hypothetical protein KOR42_06230 [Thalassoglobus neptunius]